MIGPDDRGQIRRPRLGGPDEAALKKERAIVSETQHVPVATDAAGPDAETGEADDVSDYSEEAGGLDPAGEAADAAPADSVPEDDAGSAADEAGSVADDAGSAAD